MKTAGELGSCYPQGVSHMRTMKKDTIQTSLKAPIYLKDAFSMQWKKIQTVNLLGLKHDPLTLITLQAVGHSGVHVLHTKSCKTVWRRTT